MFVSSKEMIQKAKAVGYAVPAFNAENMEMAQAIVAAAEEANSPVIIQTTAPTVKYFVPTMTHAIVAELQWPEEMMIPKQTSPPAFQIPVSVML